VNRLYKKTPATKGIVFPLIAGAKLDYKKAPAEENADRGMIRGKWECFGECFFFFRLLPADPSA
jgi:hypothetical protein